MYQRATRFVNSLEPRRWLTLLFGEQNRVRVCEAKSQLIEKWVCDEGENTDTDLMMTSGW